MSWAPALLPAWQPPVGGGWWTDGGAALDLNFANGVVDPVVTFTRASAANYVNYAGVITSAATDAPRIDYDPVTLACRGLLIEEQRTNLLLNSATLSTQNVTTSATPYTLSFYGTGTVTLSGTSTAGPLVGTGAYPNRVTLTFTPTAGTLTLTVTGSVTSAQLEAGSFATSYITTTGATATRAADVAVVSGAAFSAFYNSAAGTFVVSGHTTDGFSGVTRRLMEVNDGTAGERFTVGMQNATTARFLVTDAAAVADVGVTVTSMPARVVIAGSYAVNDVKAAANGTAGTADTSLTLPTVTQMVIGADLASPTATQMANGHIERIRYYRTALPQATLDALTA